MGNQNADMEAIQPDVWKPENEGDTIEGILIEKKENAGTYDSNAYMIDTKVKQLLIWGSTVLDDRMAFINVGERVRIVYKGKEKNQKGQPVKIFRVFREKKSNGGQDGNESKQTLP